MAKTQTAENDDENSDDVGMNLWTIDDLRRQLDIIEESYEDAEFDIVFERGGFGDGEVELLDDGSAEMRSPCKFSTEATSTPGVSPFTKSDKRLFPLIGLASHDLTDEAKENLGISGDNDE